MVSHQLSYKLRIFVRSVSPFLYLEESKIFLLSNLMSLLSRYDGRFRVCREWLDLWSDAW